MSLSPTRGRSLTQPQETGALRVAALTIMVAGSLSYLFFGILGMVSPDTILKITNTNSPVNAAATTFAHIFVARNLPIAVLPLVFLATGQRRALGYSAFFLAATQALDFIYSLGGHAALTIVASGILTIAFVLSGWYLLRTVNTEAANG